MTDSIFASLFRQAAPYIHNYRDKIFVIHFEMENDAVQTEKLLHDCAILQSLGVKIILTYGFRKTLDETLKNSNINPQFYLGKRQTTAEMLNYISNIVGSFRLQIESFLSMRNKNSPMQDSSILITSGNFITAKPLGVIDGHDFEHTGTIRNINIDKIQAHLNIGEIVLIPSIGFSPIGKIYNLESIEVAQTIASKCVAEKLIYVTNGVSSAIRENFSRQLTPASIINHSQTLPNTLTAKLMEAAKACENGIKRVHLIDKNNDANFLEELFTRDGSGIMVTNDAYDILRKATLDDIPSLRSIMEPLETAGVLVKRSEEELEAMIEHFYILARDQSIIGCAALIPYYEEKTAELASLVIAPEYRKLKKAEFLLESIQNEAKKQNFNHIFLLTTQTAEWFEDNGFVKIPVAELPKEKQAHYNNRRKSVPYRKVL